LVTPQPSKFSGDDDTTPVGLGCEVHGGRTQAASASVSPRARWRASKVFNEVERATLLSLSAGLFPVFKQAPRTVHGDGYVELAGQMASPPT
jgi:hypothetical protein